MFAHEFDSNMKILVVRIAAKLILAAKKKKTDKNNLRTVGKISYERSRYILV